ncbi:MAG: T9SS type A sorting domain-containing protein [Bacteroidetes bacterium]|nr:T9SS type A sorting domain-containing protein [Bacteroidota bacterium]
MQKILLILMSFWLLKSSSQNPLWAQLTPSAPVSGDMTSMFVDSANNILYIGGRFEYLGGKKCRGAARWNGTAWDSMGIGFDRDNMANFSNDVKKIIKYKNKIYYFGTFIQAGPFNTTGMAVWNGTSWDSTGAFPNGGVNDADVYKDTLYIGGDFTKIGAMTCSSVAKYDGTNWYNTLSFPYGAFGIRAFKNKIYIIGPYYTNGYSLTAEWNYLTGWKPSLGVQGNTAKTLNGLERIDTLLYFYGRFTHLSTMYSPCIAGYSGTQLYGVGDGGGVNNYPTIHNVKYINNKAYLLGIFESMGGMTIPGINLGVAELTGSQYCIYGQNIDNVVSDMVGYNNELIISGSFWKVNNDSIKKIAKWIGGNYTYSCSTFTPLVSGIQDYNTNSNNISLYPNPNNGIFTLSFKDVSYSAINITVKNVLGQTVYERPNFKLDNTEIKINLADLSKGIYFITVEERNQAFTTKFIIN